MILLADVGASTAKVVFIGSTIQGEGQYKWSTKGFNPTYDTEKVIQERISSWSMPKGSKMMYTLSFFTVPDACD